MKAYLISILHVDNDEYVSRYVTNVPLIIRDYGGEYVAVSKRIVRMQGDGENPDVIAITLWPSIEAIEQFFSDSRYQPYKRLRIEQSYGDIFAMETVANPVDPDSIEWKSNA